MRSLLPLLSALLAARAHAAHLAGPMGIRHRTANPAKRAMVHINIAKVMDVKGVTTTVEASSAGYDSGQWLTWFVSSTVRPSSAPTHSDKETMVAALQVDSDEGQSSEPTSTPSVELPPAVASSAPAATDNRVSQNGDEWVQAHNAARKQYGAKDLIWDESLSVKASNNAKTCSHLHSGGGENIAWLTPGTLSPQQVVDMWMSEEPLYDWNNPHYDDKWGHFTQVIWMNSARVGCYTAQCGTGVEATCEYDPAGNYIESFATNVHAKVG